MNKRIKEITLLAIATSILIVQEFLLSVLPNIQLTTLLILVYTYVFGYRKTSLIVTVHVIVDNLVFGSIGMVATWVPMLIGWQMIVGIFWLISRRTDHILVYAVSAYVFGHLYGLVFVPFQAILLNVNVQTYLLADLPFQVIMGISNFIAVLWLFNPLKDYLKLLYTYYI
jgi:hypothetical protein